MAWEETSPGRYSRPIGENETFIKLVSDPGHPLGREHWAINSTATIAPQGELIPSRLASQLRRAWGHLRFHHPSLAAYVAEDNKNLLYDVPSQEEVAKWVTKTFKVAQEESSSDEVIAKLKPSSDATLIYIPKSNELLGHTAHWRTDGIGVTLLLDGLLQLAVESDLADPAFLPWGEELKRLAPAVEDAANIPLTPNEQQSVLGKQYLSTFGLAAGAVGIPYIGETSTLPQGTHSARRTLDSEITNSIVEKCKAQGLSVTSAVHASVAAANWSFAAEERKHDHYTSTVRFSLRSYLPSPYSGPDYAAGLYTTGWMEKVDANETWLDHAKHYNKIYHKGLSRDYIDAHRVYANALGDMLRHLPPDLPIQSDVDISSIGVAETLIKRSYGSGDLAMDVVAVSVGVEILTRQAVCFVWTFRDQLNFNVVYNEAYHEKEQMQGFLKAVEESLITGLSISSD
jgi:hypothetical protein